MKQKTLFAAFLLYFICTLTAMAFMNVSFFLLFALLLALVSRNPSRFAMMNEVRATPYFSSYQNGALLLLFTCFLSLIIAKIDPLTYAGHAPEVTLHGFLKIWYLFCPAIFLAAFHFFENQAATLERLTRYWLYSLIPLFIFGLIQFNTGLIHHQDIPTNPGHYHVTLFFGHHLSTASILIFPAFIAFSLFLGKVKREKTISPLYLITFACGLGILFLSYARTAWLAIPLGTIILFIRYLKPKTVILSTLLLFLCLGLASQTPLMKERIEKLYGVSERVELWKANVDYFTHRPLTGIGWLKTQEMSEFYFREKFPTSFQNHFWGHAHSNFFEMLGGTGLLGVLAFFFWSFFTLKLAYQTSRLAREKQEGFLEDLSWGIFAALLLLHFNGLTNVTFWEGKVMHSQMLAVGLLLICQAAMKKGKIA